MENVEPITQEKKSPTENSQPNGEPQKNVLLGTISYTDETAYEQFLQKMDLNQAIFVLIAATNFAQAKGTYLAQESELIAVATRAIRKSASKTSPTSEQIDSEKK